MTSKLFWRHNQGKQFRNIYGRDVYVWWRKYYTLCFRDWVGRFLAKFAVRLCSLSFTLHSNFHFCAWVLLNCEVTIEPFKNMQSRLILWAEFLNQFYSLATEKMLYNDSYSSDGNRNKCIIIHQWQFDALYGHFVEWQIVNSAQSQNDWNCFKKLNQNAAADSTNGSFALKKLKK